MTSDRIYYIYKVTNTINNKSYIGQTCVSLKARKGQHIRSSKYGSMLPMHCSIRKYGVDSFSWDVIDTVNNFNDANTKEMYWIQHYDSMCGFNGYNLREGGKQAPHSDETKRKMSISHTGKRASDMTRGRMSTAHSGKNNSFYGKRHTKESMRKRLVSLGDYRHSDDTRLKMSNAHKGKYINQEISDKAAFGKTGIKFNVFTLDGVLVGSWCNYARCARDLNIGSANSIKRYALGLVKTKKTYMGYRFKLAMLGGERV